MSLGPEEIRAEADRILTSGSFKRSGRLSRFLRFVVENSLEGRQEQLKEYVLGVEVYEKGANFDPRLDSTVRVEAARLRAKLREYYETEGRQDPLRIELPKGGYAPLFRPTELHASPDRRSKTSTAVWIAGVVLAGSIAIAVFVKRPRTEPAAALNVKPLTTWPGRELQPCFSPDGSRIAIAWGGENDDNYDIYVKPIGDGPLVRLTTDPATDRSPAWSPDGGYIAFIRDSPGSVGLYVVPATGGAERLVGRLRPAAAQPTARMVDWFPDGQALVLADRDSAKEPFSLYRVSLATGERRRLTSPPPQSYGDFQPALSPGGRTLAFTRSLTTALSDIYIAPAGGGEARRITFESQVILGLAWSEDGRSIVFSSERGATAGAGSLWRIHVEGPAADGRLEQVPGIGPRASHPAIARRGRRLAYQESFQDTNLWRAETSGRRAPELVISSTREEARADYSPDGRRVVFESNRSGNWEVWMANADGSGARQVTSFAGAPATHPRWSRDGRLIVFNYAGAGNKDIYTMTPEGKSLRRLTSEPSRDENPSWSKDGRWLYFSSNRSGDFEIWKLAVDQPARVEELTHGGGAWPRESPDGRYLYFNRGPAEASEIWRMAVSGGPETRVLGPHQVGAGWVLDQNGIYLLDPDWGITYYRFADGRATQFFQSPRMRSPACFRAWRCRRMDAGCSTRGRTAPAPTSCWLRTSG